MSMRKLRAAVGALICALAAACGGIAPDAPGGSTAGDGAFEAFEGWYDRYRAAAPAQRQALEAEGVELARIRL